MSDQKKMVVLNKSATSVDTFYFGTHFMIDGYEAPSNLLKDAELLEKAMIEIINKMGMHAISEPLVIEVGPNNKKDPGGLSGFLLIAESHISFHTFPARGFVTIDVYTCQDTLNTKTLLEHLKNFFGFSKEETHLVKRGRNYPAENIQE
jgi:S-adenosylmethionine decarboxylase